MEIILIEIQRLDHPFGIETVILVMKTIKLKVSSFYKGWYDENKYRKTGDPKKDFFWAFKDFVYAPIGNYKYNFGNNWMFVNHKLYDDFKKEYDSQKPKASKPLKFGHTSSKKRLKSAQTKWPNGFIK